MEEGLRKWTDGQALHAFVGKVAVGPSSQSAVRGGIASLWDDLKTVLSLSGPSLNC